MKKQPIKFSEYPLVVPNAKRMSKKLDKLVSDLKSRVLTECNQDERFIVSVSVGAAKLREYENLKHLFDEADHMLYEDKAKFHKLNG